MLSLRQKRNNELFKNTPVIVITGPTASGKSALAIELAKKFEGIIINADSKQVYEEISIGTARPIPDTTHEDYWIIDGVKHYLFGHISVNDGYSLYQYQKEVYSVMTSNPGKPVFLVGGTGLYIDSVVKGYDLVESDGSCSEERAKLEKLSLTELQELTGEKLKKLNNSDRNNPRRLIRIIEKANAPLDVQSESGRELNHLYLVLDKDRKSLKENIRTRVDQMFSEGLISEVETVKDLIISKDKTLDILGYQEFREYFSGKISLEEVKQLIVTHTNQYMKRQLTWFRGREDAEFVEGFIEAEVYIEKFLRTFESPLEEI